MSILLRLSCEIQTGEVHALRLKLLDNGIANTGTFQHGIGGAADHADAAHGFLPRKLESGMVAGHAVFIERMQHRPVHGFGQVTAEHNRRFGGRRDEELVYPALQTLEGNRRQNPSFPRKTACSINHAMQETVLPDFVEPSIQA